MAGIPPTLSDEDSSESDIDNLAPEERETVTRTGPTHEAGQSHASEEKLKLVNTQLTDTNLPATSTSSPSISSGFNGSSISESEEKKKRIEQSPTLMEALCLVPRQQLLGSFTRTAESVRYLHEVLQEELQRQEQLKEEHQ